MSHLTAPDITTTNGYTKRAAEACPAVVKNKTNFIASQRIDYAITGGTIGTVVATSANRSLAEGPLDAYLLTATYTIYDGAAASASAIIEKTIVLQMPRRALQE